mgnify:CR=1 FL=1
MLISNLIIGSNEATTLAGSSFGLSFPADKERMQIIRGEAGAILVGGNTYRSEPYQRLEKPVLVASSQVDYLPRPLLGEILPLSPVELELRQVWRTLSLDTVLDAIARVGI